MRQAPLALVLALSLILAGCGGDDEPAATKTVTVEQATTTSDSRPAANVFNSVPGVEFDASAIYEKDAPGVVTVLSLYDQSAAVGGSRGAEGSGFVLNDKGEIATNAHVVTQGEGEEIRKVDQVYVRFPNRNQVEAEIVGFDPNEDVALLKIDPEGLDLTPLELGSSSELKVGAPVAAIGSPFGEEGSLSIGVISALDRTLESLTKFQISGAIQTDAAINHGNSGGPLVDFEGKVLGINSQINSSSGDNSGVGFAIPIDSVKRSLDELRSKGRVDYAYLGVSSSSLYPQLAERLGLPVDHGAIIAEVVEDGPAEDAGLRAGDDEIRFQGDSVPRDSDIITAVEGTEVRLDADLGRILEGYGPGETVDLEVYRNKEKRTVSVKLGSRPASP
ncbi:MAG: trypsin-like peptidase domain-containing protein [Solirubrobacteraceae bacterium]